MGRLSHDSNARTIVLDRCGTLPLEDPEGAFEEDL
jgi:hypothetical protein